MRLPRLPNTLGSRFSVPASHLIEELLPQIRSIVRWFDVRMEPVDDVGSFSLVDIFEIRLSNHLYWVIVRQNLIDRDHERRELCSRVFQSSPVPPKEAVESKILVDYEEYQPQKRRQENRCGNDSPQMVHGSLKAIAIAFLKISIADQTFRLVRGQPIWSKNPHRS